jgi:ABC-type lipoprotein release transport system permease subunit
MLEGMLQAGVAAVVGLTLASPFMAWLQVYGVDIGVLGGVSMVGANLPTVWHGTYTVAVLQVPVIMLFAIVFAAVLYPAAKAAWISPVEAMHHQ